MNLSDVIATSSAEAINSPLVKLLIDGDIIAYKAASITDGRMYTIKGGNPEVAWKYKADVVAHCEDRSIPLDKIQISFFPEPITHATKIIQQLMSGIKSNLGTRFPNVEMVTYLTGSTNYRYAINPQYKASRNGLRKPENLAGCKQFLVDNYSATYDFGLEADDSLAIAATELGPGNCVICSIDKDLKQIPGLHYNFDKDELEEITFAQGQRLLWGQVISGDSTDNIHSPRGLGKVAGEKLYQNVDFDTAQEEDLIAMACQCYSTKMKGTLDHSDIECFVKQTLDQVYLLRDQKDIDAVWQYEEGDFEKPKE